VESAAQREGGKTRWDLERWTEEKVRVANMTWNTAEKMAPERVLWRSIVDALCSTRSIKKD